MITTFNLPKAWLCMLTILFALAAQGQLTVTTTVNHMDCGDINAGSISLSASGGSTPYAYKWSTLATTSSVSGLASGIYIATVYDSGGDSVVRSVALGYKTTWDVLLKYEEDSIGRVAAVNTDGFYDNYTFGLNSLAPHTDGWIEYYIAAGDTVQGLLGFAHNMTRDNDSRGYGFLLYGTYLMAQGVTLPTTPPFIGLYAKGSAYRLRMVFDGDSIRFVQMNASGTILAQSAFYYLGHGGSAGMVGLSSGSRVAAVYSSFDCSRLRLTFTTGPVPDVHTKGNISADIRGGVPPYSYLWSNGATTKDLNSVGVGDYALTVTDADSSTVSNSAFVGAYVSWEPLLNMVENEERNLISLISALSEDDNPQAYAGGLNVLPEDTLGILLFEFKQTVDFAGLVGFVSEDTLSGDTLGMGLIVLPNDLEGFSDDGLYFMQPDSDMVYLGSMVDSVPLTLKMYKNDDTLTVIKNDVVTFSFRYNFNNAATPLVMPLAAGAKVERTTCNFATRKPLPPHIPTGVKACSDTGYHFVFDSIRNGSGGNKTQWSLHADFSSSSYIYDLGSIGITVGTGAQDTVYMRSQDTVSGIYGNSTSFIVKVFPLPSTHIAPEDTTIVLQEMLTLTASGGSAYEWENLYTDSASLTTMPVADSAFYYVAVTDTNGCSRRDSAQVKVVPYPEITYVNYSDTINADDTAHIEITTLFDGPVSWIRDNENLVTGLLGDTGQIIRVPLSNTTDSFQTVHFLIKGYSTKYGILEGEATIAMRGRQAADIQLETDFEDAIACKSDNNYSFTVQANAPYNQFGIRITYSATGGGTFNESNVSNIRINTVPIGSEPNFSTSINTTTHSILIYTTSSVTSGTEYTISYDIDVPCAALPTGPTNPQITQAIEIVQVNGSAFTSSPPIITIDGTEQSSDNITVNIDRPIISVTNGSTSTQTVNMTLGATQHLTLHYINSGGADFNGDVSFNLDEFDCDGIVQINSVEFTGAIDHGPVTYTGSDIVITDASVAATSTFDVVVEFELLECLPEEFTECETFARLQWSCGATNNCKAALPIPISIKQTSDRPYVVISRVKMPPPQPTVDARAWDGSCMGTEDDLQEWEYVVINRGSALAENVRINLATPANTYTLIGSSDITKTANDSRFIYSEGVPSLTLPSATVVSLSSGEYASHCTSGLNGSPVESWQLVIDKVYPGQNVVVKFKTYRCCPKNIAFNSGANFNRWTIGGKYDYCGEENNFNNVLPENLSWLADSYPNGGGTPVQTYRASNNGPISSHAQDGNPDLSLQQTYEMGDQHLTGADDESCETPPCCGTSKKFQIRNRIFSSNGNSDYDTQIFSGTGVPGGNAGVTGANPDGRFQVVFAWTPGLAMDASIPPTITNNGITWNALASSYSVDNTSRTAKVMFDISGVYDLDGTGTHPTFSTSFAFRNFFLGSNINFWLSSCCPLPENTSTATVTVQTSFNPLPNTDCDACDADFDSETDGATCCMIPLSELEFDVNMHCPGCKAPGLILDEFSFLRTNLGYQDNLNFGVPEEPLTTITMGSSYITSHPSVNVLGSIAGDNLEVRAHAFFVDGDPGETFSYEQWQQDWEDNTTPPTRPVITDWYFEQNITNATSVGLECIGAQLRRKPKGSSTWGSYVSLAGISPTTPLVPHSVSNRILFHSDIITLFGTVDIIPEDEFEFVAQYRACTNPSATVELQATNYMYLTVAPLNLTTYPYPFQNGVSHVGDVYDDNAPTTGYEAFDPADASDNDGLFYCDAFGTSMSTHKVYPITRTYSETWDNQNSCNKSLTVRAGYQIVDGAFRNAFPYEYRFVPRIDPTDIGGGPWLAPNTNPWGTSTREPITFHITIPQGYKATFNRVFTEAAMYHNLIQPASLISQDVNASDITVTTNVLATWPDVIASGADVSFDCMVNLSEVVFVPPFSSYGYTVPMIFPYPNQTLPNTSSMASLAIGDENFVEGIQFDITPICSLAEESSSTIAHGDVNATIPDYTQPCETDDDMLVDNGTSTTYTLSVPNPSITVTASTVQVFSGNFVDCPVSINTNGMLNSTQEITAENMIFYLKGSDLPTGVTLVSVTEVTGGGSTSLTDHAAATDYHIFEVGTVDNSERDFVIRLELATCSLLVGEDFDVDFYYQWSCDGFPDYNDEGLVFPDPTECSTPVSLNISVQLPEIATDVDLVKVPSSAYATCQGVEYTATIKSSDVGGIGNMLGTIRLPIDVSIDANNVQVEFNGGTYALSSSLVTSAAVPGSSTELDWNFDISTLTAFSSGSLIGEDGLNNAANEVAGVTIRFRIIIPCRTASYTPSLPSLVFKFQVEKYCNDVVTLSSNSISAPSNIANGCGPHATIELINGSCWGPYTYNIEIGDFGEMFPTPPYFHTSFSPNQPNAETPTPGTYTLTVTDANGCIDIQEFVINTPFSVNETHTASVCAGSRYGKIDLTPAGGTSPHSYHWNGGGGVTTEDRTKLFPGTYNATVTDDLGCAVTKSITIASDNTCCDGGYSTLNGWNAKLTFKNLTSTELMSYLGIGNTLFLPSSQIAFNGTFTIDNNFNILSSNFVTFAPGAQVQINQGKQLLVLNSSLYACSGQLWKGIEALGASLFVNSAGTIYVANSKIADAQYAIKLNPKARISLTNSTLENNFVGVYYTASNQQNFLANVTTINPIYGNVFWGTRPLLPAYTGMVNGANQPNVSQVNWAWAGMHLNNLNNITVGAEGVKYNLFYKTANGVISNNCNLRVVNSVFNRHQAYSYNYSVSNTLPYQGNGVLAHSNQVQFQSGNILVPARGLTMKGNGEPSYWEIVLTDNPIVADRMNVDIRKVTVINNVPSIGKTSIRISNSRYSNIKLATNSVSDSYYNIMLSNNDPVLVSDIFDNRLQNLGFANIVLAESLHNPHSSQNIWLNSITQAGYYGILGINSSGSDIHNNNLFITTAKRALIGIGFAGCSNTDNYENYVTCVQTTIQQNTDGYPVGLYSYGSSTTRHTCNTIENIWTGAMIRDINRDFGANNLFRGNRFNRKEGPLPRRMNTGLWVTKPSTLDRNNYGGNKWQGNYNTNLGALNDNPTAIALNTQRFTVRFINNNPDVMPTHNPQGWFTTGFAQSNYLCSYPTPPSPPTGGGFGLTEIDEAIMNGLLEYDEPYTAAMRWKNEKQLYDKLRENPDVVASDTLAAQFFNDRYFGTMEKLAVVEDYKNAAMQPDSLIWDYWLNARNAIDAITESIFILDSARVSLTDSLAIEQAAWKIDSLNMQIDSISNCADSLKAIYVPIRDSLLWKAIEANNRVADTVEIAMNYKDVNAIYLQYVAMDSAELDETQRETLLTVAGLCPITGGNAVFMARSLVSLFTDTLFDDDQLCDTSRPGVFRMKKAEEKKRDTEEELLVKLYPNPANDYAILQFSRPMEGKFMLSVADIMGRLTINESLNLSGTQYSINTTHLSSGIYLVNLYGSNSKIYEGKLVIIPR